MPARAPADPCPIDPGSGLAGFVITWFAAAVASSAVLVAVAPSDGETSLGALAASLVAGWAVFVAGAVVTSRRAGSGDPVADLGARFAPIDAVGVPLGVVAQLVLVPAVYVPLRAVWPATFDDRALVETAEDLVARAPGGLVVVLFALVVVGAPVVEELTYRGLLQRPLLGWLPTPLVVVLVAAVFALVHFRPVEYPGLFLAGLVFGVAAWRTGRIGTSIATHVAFNATGLLLAL